MVDHFCLNVDEYQAMNEFPVRLLQLPRLTHCSLSHANMTPNFVMQLLQSVKFKGRGKRMLIEIQLKEGLLE